MPKLREPSIKQRKWAKITAKTGNATQAALQSYETHSYNAAKSIGQQNLTTPSTRALLEKELRDGRITENRITNKLDSLLEAKTPITFEGAITAETNDNNVQLKALRTAAELLDLFPSKKYDKRSVVLELKESMSREQLRALLKDTSK